MGSASAIWTCLGLFAAWSHCVRASIQPLYDRFAAAYVKNDVVTMLSILSPDYVLVNAVGTKVTRQDYEKTLIMRNMNRAEAADYTVKILEIKPIDNGALIHTRETYADRANHTHEYADRWSLVDGSWRLVETRTLKEN